MIFQNKVDVKRFYMFIAISAFINIIMILIIPSCSKVSYEKELEFESIKAGLISIVDTNKREFRTENKIDNSSQEETFSQETRKSDGIEVIIPTNNTEKTTKENQTINNNDLSGKPKVSGTSSEESKTQGLVITSNTSKTSRTSSEGLTSSQSTNSSNTITTTNNLANSTKGIDSGSKETQGASKTFDSGTKDKNSLGQENTNQGTVAKDPVISINSTGANTSLPQNISYSTLDVTGGSVVFVRYVAPIYPEIAERNAWNGNVEVEFLVRNGRSSFSGITRKSGYTAIDRAVERAARNWALTIEKDGIALSGRVRVQVEFNF